MSILLRVLNLVPKGGNIVLDPGVVGSKHLDPGVIGSKQAS